jgi:DNA-binding transcriptional regulator YhcF (GntR family)
MQLHVSTGDGVPIYLQIANRSNTWSPRAGSRRGMRFPPFVLAHQLLINPNTVARAYLELEREGVVQKRHGSGTYISDTGSPLARKERLKILAERIDALLAEARHLQVEPLELLRLIKERSLSIQPKENQMNTSDVPIAVEITGLSRRFGSKLALNQVSLQVKRGRVFGLVGANGAGKTTLIKHLLGRLKPESGSVRVFGFDPVAEPVAVLSRIGYLSENRDLPAWMRVDELLRYTAAFYPKWDMGVCRGIARTIRPGPARENQDALARRKRQGRPA